MITVFSLHHFFTTVSNVHFCWYLLGHFTLVYSSLLIAQLAVPKSEKEYVQCIYILRACSGLFRDCILLVLLYCDKNSCINVISSPAVSLPIVFIQSSTPVVTCINTDNASPMIMYHFFSIWSNHQHLFSRPKRALK